MIYTATSAQCALVRELLGAVDRRDAPAVSTYLAENVTLVFGNDEPVHGRAGALETMSVFLGAIGSIRHDISSIFADAGDENHLVVRMTVHYELADGSVFALPCCNTFRVAEGKVTEYQVYMDVTPVANRMTAV